VAKIDFLHFLKNICRALSCFASLCKSVTVGRKRLPVTKCFAFNGEQVIRGRPVPVISRGHFVALLGITGQLYSYFLGVPNENKANICTGPFEKCL